MKALLAIAIYCTLLTSCYDSRLSHNTKEIEVKVSVENEAQAFNVQFAVRFAQSTPTSLRWDFGDGYHAQGKTLQHKYASPGVYLASLEYSEQGQIIHEEIRVEIPGDNRRIHIGAQQPFTIDSDHNDPNLPFTRNDNIAQKIDTPITLSGFLIDKNICQGGRLCLQGDLVDNYRFKLDYSDEITLQIINGTLDIELTREDDSLAAYYPQQSSFLTIPAHSLGNGQFQLSLSLGKAQSSARYLLSINKMAQQENSNYQPGKLIVTWQDQTQPELVDMSDKRLLKLPRGNLLNARDLFSRKSNVGSVSLNYYRQALDASSQMTSWQWPLSFQNIDKLWQPLQTRGQAPGENITVAVLDTGIFSQHPNLKGLKRHSGFDFVSDPVNGGDGDGWDGDPEDPGDNQGSFHGTHITGIIAAQPPQYDSVTPWVQGLAWGVDIMPLRVLGLNGGTSFDMIQALRYAAGLDNQSGQLPEKPADIINLSLGGSQFSAAEQATLDAVIDSGAIVVAAAGNQSRSQVNFPAGYQNVIAVGALTQQGGLASYGNHGPYLDLMAPGGECLEFKCSEGIYGLGAKKTSLAHEFQANWHNLAGTSMASAHVSAMLAILRSDLPALDSHELHTLISQQAINSNSGETGFSQNTGWGSLDSEKMMNVLASSSLDHGQVWSSHKDIFLSKHESRALTLTFRGPHPIHELNLDYDPSHLEVSLNKNKLNIRAKQTLDQSQTLIISSIENHNLMVNIHGKNTQSFSPALEHLYLTLSDETYDGPVRRAAKQVSDWQAYVPTINTGQIIQVSSDLDYDGVYCEPGEFCAVTELDNQPTGEVKLWGKLLSH